MLAHPEVVDLVVDAHALALVAQRAAAGEELQDVVVAVERPAVREEAAEEPVGIRIVGRPPAPPHVRVGDDVAIDVLADRRDLDPCAYGLPQLRDLLEGQDVPVRDDEVDLG